MIKYHFNKGEIAARLNITPPFLMIDTYQEIEPAVQAVATKNVSGTEWWFDCHLPDKKVMPGTLIVEGMLQTLVFLIYNANRSICNPALITNMKVKVRAPVKPGDSIKYIATLKKLRRGIATGEVSVESNNILVCSGEFEYAVPDLMYLPK
jgi:3-hydroxyacyl-[acyl-carrier-protein] dehydratase